MSLRQKIEDHPFRFLVTSILIGFGAGFAVFQTLLDFSDRYIKKTDCAAVSNEDCKQMRQLIYILGSEETSNIVQSQRKDVKSILYEWKPTQPLIVQKELSDHEKDIYYGCRFDILEAQMKIVGNILHGGKIINITDSLRREWVKTEGIIQKNQNNQSK